MKSIGGMMTYTKGPWKMDSGQVVRSSDGAVIANMDRSDAAWEAGIQPVERNNNARLIASAPDMRRALDEIAEAMLEHLHDDEMSTEEMRDAIAFALDMAPPVKRVRQ